MHNNFKLILVSINSASAVLQKIVEFKDFSRLLSDFPVLFKADLIFKDFSRNPSKFQVLFKSVRTLYNKQNNCWVYDAKWLLLVETEQTCPDWQKLENIHFELLTRF